jgi:hypothetical protein
MLDLRCELADDGVNATTWVRTLGGDGIVAWTADLAESYHGWDGERTWTSLSTACVSTRRTTDRATSVSGSSSAALGLLNRARGKHPSS